MRHNATRLYMLALLCAISAPSESPASPIRPGSFGLGIQAAPFPIFGPALTFNASRSLALQTTGRFGVDVDFMSARGLYRIKQAENYHLYTSALLGFFRDPNVSPYLLGPKETDAAIGFGVGAGVEYFFSGLPNMGWNVEVDYIRIGFEDKWYEYDYETPQLIMLGLGINYYL